LCDGLVTESTRRLEVSRWQYDNNKDYNLSLLLVKRKKNARKKERQKKKPKE
jgi:hypothetical protein